MSAERLAGAAATGDAEASAVIRRAASALGEAIAFAVNLLDPEAVVLGGGLALGGGLYRQTLNKRCARTSGPTALERSRFAQARSVERPASSGRRSWAPHW